MRESGKGWLGAGRAGEVTVAGFLHAEARFPGVWREPLGEAYGQETLGRLGAGGSMLSGS